jgi:hypothetical protein
LGLSATTILRSAYPRLGSAGMRKEVRRDDRNAACTAILVENSWRRERRNWYRQPGIYISTKRIEPLTKIRRLCDGFACAFNADRRFHHGTRMRTMPHQNTKTPCHSTRMYFAS